MPAPVATADALLLVDLQRGFLTGTTAVPAADVVVSAAEVLLEAARLSGAPVIHLQNDGPPGAIDEPGHPGWQLHLQPQAAEPVIRKTGDDGFAGTSLGALLTARRVRHLVVCGIQSEMCVAATVRAALASGMAVLLPHDAHATYSIPASDKYGPQVPAATVARVAEWSLGDRLQLVPHARDVGFAPTASDDHAAG